MKKKCILHLISGLEVGGAETQLLRILPELQAYHDNIVCCVRGRGPIGKELEKNGIPVRYLDFGGFSDVMVIRRFYCAIKELSPDIIVTYLIHADLYGRIFGKIFGVKKIVSSKRGALLQWEWLARIDWFTKWMVSHYLVQTRSAQNEWMGRLHLSEDRFSIVPNGLDISHFETPIDKNEECKKLSIDTTSFIITCVSRLRKGKGHEVLLKAFETFYKRNQNTTLLLVGDGERESELKGQIENYASRNNVFFLGNRSDVPIILALSDLFILPTEGEGMSNAIMEAMAAGLPIITTDIPENRDLIEEGRTGILFPVSDDEILSDKISFLLENTKLREELGKNAKKEAREKYDVEKVVLKFAEFYRKI